MYNPDFDDAGPLATHSDAMREYAYNAGCDQPDRPWLLTSYDVFVRNPHYVGPACLRDGVDPNDPDPDFLDAHAGCSAHGRCLHGFGDPVFDHPVYVTPALSSDDLLPF